MVELTDETIAVPNKNTAFRPDMKTTPVSDSASFIVNLHTKHNRMKQSILFLFAVLTVSFTYAQEIQWMKIEQAQTLSQQDSKFIIMDVYTPWCGPCKYMEQMTFSDESVISYVNEHFHAVKFNGEGPDDATLNGVVYKNEQYDPARGNGRNFMHDLTKHLQVAGYPTVVVFNDKGEKINAFVGFKTPEVMLSLLKQVVEGE